MDVSVAIWTRDTPWRQGHVLSGIEDVFTKKYFDPANEKWNGIHLKACLPISEDDMPVSKTRLLTEWRLEHMSLRAQQQPAKQAWDDNAPHFYTFTPPAPTGRYFFSTGL